MLVRIIVVIFINLLLYGIVHIIKYWDVIWQNLTADNIEVAWYVITGVSFLIGILLLLIYAAQPIT